MIERVRQVAIAGPDFFTHSTMISFLSETPKRTRMSEGKPSTMKKIRQKCVSELVAAALFATVVGAMEQPHAFGQETTTTGLADKSPTAAGGSIPLVIPRQSVPVACRC